METRKEAFLRSFVEKQHCRKESAGVKRRIMCLRLETEEAFTQKVLEELETEGKGIFTNLKNNQTTHQYRCERSWKSTSRTKDPRKTRGNGCDAYVSFQFVTVGRESVAIVRERLTHSGHDPTSSAEMCASKIDENLRIYIECLLSQGKKSMEILTLCWGWAQCRNHNDFQNRRYYPTAKDVSNIAAAYRLRQRHHKDDAVSVDHLCSVVMKSSIVLYEAMENEKPLIIVYQNLAQVERMKKYGKSMVFMDASYKGLTGYGYAVYVIQARDDRGHGTPLSYFITSSDTTDVITKCLQALKEHARKNKIIFEPRAIMVDKDLKEITAIKTTFPHTDVLLCWFHVLQAIYRWLNKTGSGVSGNNKVQERKEIIQVVRKMKYTTTEEEFDQYCSELPNTLKDYPNVTKYIQQNWTQNGRMWSNFGRRFYHQDHETNNLVERFFLGLKYHFLGGFGNRRVDELLLLLDGNVSKYESYMEELVKAGRLVSNQTMEDPLGRQQAQHLLLRGWAQKCVWVDNKTCECHVPSQSDLEKMWLVDLARATCTCPAAPSKGMCKHYHVALNVAAMRNKDVKSARKLIAEELFEKEQYTVDGIDVTVIDTDTVSTVIGGKQCTCIAASHGLDCICLMVAQLANSEQAQVNEDSSPVAEDTSAPEMRTHSTDTETAKQQISEIHVWMEQERGTFEGHERKGGITQSIKQLHTMIFGKKFKVVNRKRKIEPNCTYREAIDRAKRMRLHNDHMYVSVRGNQNKKTQKKSGISFGKNRNAKGLRKAFQ